MTLLGRAKKDGKKFLNPVPTAIGGFRMMLKVLPQYVTNRKQRFPLVAPGPFATDSRIYAEAPPSGLRVTWFGHSSSLLEIDGVRMLIDPVWDPRASPLEWTGPKRFYAPTIALDELPELDVILISHDHYDHLGKRTVQTLARQANAARAVWVTSVGVGAVLESFGVQRARIVELDWTETHRLTLDGRSVKITAWPARHFSGRSLRNRFETLWGSFAIDGEQHSVYYGADSGPWPGFAEVGRKHGGFDLTMLEIGAYDALWGDIHLGPDGAAEAFADMGGSGLLMPIHWGLFDLALHGWREPIERMRELGRERGIALWSPEPGRPTEVERGLGVESDWWVARAGESV